MLLIGLGLVLNAVAAWPAVLPLRFPGVLQRVAVSYLIASLVVLHLDVPVWGVTAVALMLAHWALLTLVPFGGHPAGTLTPQLNIARYVDTRVFGRHLLLIPTDPEGLLGTLSAAATALFGALAGHVLRTTATAAGRVRRLLTGGTLAVIAATAWSAVLPIGKPLWTGSFALLTSGLGALALAVIYFVVDVEQWRGWAAPFLWLGVNPLAIYFMSELVGHLQTMPKAWIYWAVLQPAMPRAPEMASLVFGVGFVAVWVGVAGALYRQRVRIQV
jgi:predicted acyltransferase